MTLSFQRFYIKFGDLLSTSCSRITFKRYTSGLRNSLKEEKISRRNDKSGEIETHCKNAREKNGGKQKKEKQEEEQQKQLNIAINFPV